jgi:hypothetical protein
MAGDWIKMRADLHTHPKVVRMSSALNADRLRTIGGLHAVWCLFDAHSLDGTLDGYTLEALDSMIGWPGFSASMAAVGWLEVSDHSLGLPRFDEHNSKGAKRRATETERKRTARAGGDSVRNVSASDADEKRSREEKRREEEIPPNPRKRGQDEPAGFTRFWAAWPASQRKVARAQCLRKWLKAGCEDFADRVVVSVEAHKLSADWTKDNGGFIPAPIVWLNQSRWEAELPASPAASSIASGNAELQRAREQAARAVPPPAAVLELAKRMRVG